MCRKAHTQMENSNPKLMSHWNKRKKSPERRAEHPAPKRSLSNGYVLKEDAAIPAHGHKHAH